MKSFSFWSTIVGAAMLCSSAVAADGVSFGLQVRPRVEKSVKGNIGPKGGNIAAVGGSDFKPTQRTRLTANYSSGSFSSRLSIQDVRTWSEETSTLKDYSADGMDMHEAWVHFGGNTFARVGRQEVALDGQRLIGAVNWTQQARAFDGVLLGHVNPDANYSIYLFGARLGEGVDVYVAYPRKTFGNIALSIPLIYLTNDGIAGHGDVLGQFTGGFHASAKGDLSWRLEGYFQQTSVGDADPTTAMMVGARVGMKVSSMLSPVLWVDYLSGADAENNKHTFSTIAATNHKFYGFADHFLNVGVHTKGGGLIDIALKNTGSIAGGKLHIALHHFMLAGPDSQEFEGTIGQEIDVIYTRKIADGLKIQAGVTVFMDGGDFVYANQADKDADNKKTNTMHDWSYLQLIMNI